VILDVDENTGHAVAIERLRLPYQGAT
jgi:hypothetical protein